jgi:hypothetical protein
MGKSRATKDLREIQHLFTPAVREASFAAQLAAAESAPLPVEDIDVAILALMTNYRGWTVGDVQRCLAKHPDADQIPALMNKFVNEGKFDIMHVTGRANTYTLKRKPLETITSARNKAAPFKLADPVGTRQAPDPKGVIVLEEGLDVAIWKIMSDNKARSKNEICMMLAEYKFDRVIINRRVDTMINSRNYFDRRDGGHGGMRYSMKKHVPMPKPQNAVDDAPAEFAKVRENFTEVKKVDTIDAYQGGQASFSPRPSRERGIGSIFTTTAAVELEHTAPADGAALVAQEEASAQLAEYSTKSALDYAVTMADDDHLNTLIWKAMSDHKPYKSEEVAILVQAVRPSQSTKSIANRLSLLGIEGWFEIEKSGRANTWTLKESTPNPNLKINDLAEARMANARAARAEEPAVSQQQELPVDTNQAAEVVAEVVAPVANVTPEITPIETQEENEMSKAASLVQVVAKNAPISAPLIELAIPIKGQKFTFAECRQLVDELRALGYGRDGGAVSVLSLVNQQVTIKGVVFEKDELDNIVKALVVEGFGSHHVSKR